MSGFLDYLSDKYQSENVKAINQRLLELSSLFEISQILNSSLDIKNVLNNILLIPMGRLLIAKGIIFLKDQEKFLPRLFKGLKSSITEINFREEDLPSTPMIIDKIDQKYQKVSKFCRTWELPFIIPIVSQEKIIGVTFFGNKLNKVPFSEDETDFLLSLANLSASAIENALKVDEINRINKQLDERIQQLKTLFDIAQGLSATLESDKIIRLLSYALMGQMMIYHYAIVLLNEKGLPKIECKGFKANSLKTIIAKCPQLCTSENAQIIDNFVDPYSKNELMGLGAKVLIPMRHQNRPLGFILLGEKMNKKKYSETELEFLSTIVNQAIISLENSRLFKETVEKERMEQELQVAKIIQKKLLPREIIPISGYDIWGLNSPSKEVGGDYFDIIPITSSRFALAIGDVSGKSIPAALLMANLQAGLRTIITENQYLDQVVSKLNNLIFQNTDIDRYITFFIGILDTDTHEFIYVNAGHNPPFFFNRRGKVSLLHEGGIILGMIPDYHYQTGKIKFERESFLVCYTDGVSEASNVHEEEYGEERLQQFIIKHKNIGAQKMCELLVESINQHAIGVSQYDDITLLVAGRNP
jgi:sigma-B regulation protein RsbU (phosphoserine phosphatase)